MSTLKFVRKHRKELVRTTVVYICFVLYAACSVSPGIALLDLQVLVETSFATISKLIPIRQSGYTLGGILGAVLERYANLYLTLGVCVISFGAIEMIIPMTTNFIVMSCLCFFTGLFQAIVDMFLNTLLVSLWREKSANFVQLFHILYAVGGLICPLIVRPFMLPSENEAEQVGNKVKVDNIHGLTHGPQDVQIHWPFLIIGIPTVLIGTCFFMFYKKSEKSDSSSHEGPNDSENKTGTTLVPQYTISSLVAVACTFSFPIWILISGFSQSYGVKSSLKLTSQSSALTATFFWTFFLISRIMFIASSFFVTQKYVISILAVTLFIGSVLLIGSGFLGYPLFLLAVIMIAFGASPLPALTLTWPSKYFNYSGRQTSMIFLINLIGEFLHSIIFASLFGCYPETFTYYIAGLNVCFIIVFTLIPFVCKILCKGKDGKGSHLKPEISVIKRLSVSSAIIPVIISRRLTKPFSNLNEISETE